MSGYKLMIMDGPDGKALVRYIDPTQKSEYGGPHFTEIVSEVSSDELITAITGSLQDVNVGDMKGTTNV